MLFFGGDYIKGLTGATVTFIFTLKGVDGQIIYEEDRAVFSLLILAIQKFIAMRNDKPGAETGSWGLSNIMFKKDCEKKHVSPPSRRFYSFYSFHFTSINFFSFIIASNCSSDITNILKILM